jgi:excisionase family DNA binding protein
MTERPHVYKHAQPAYLDVQAFADHFAVSKMTIYRLCHSGEVRWVRVGAVMRIPVAELRRYARDADRAAFREVWGEDEA